MLAEKRLLAALAGEALAVPPVWLMRQAGRYLPEYREIRAKAKSFLDFCYSPAAAAEVTLQPIRRFHFDAAILFSDILVIPDAMGQRVSFETGEGPRLDPLDSVDKIERLNRFNIDKLSPVFETVDRVKGALPKDVAFIGFCGAPWTVASYMIAGKGTKEQEPARLFAYRHPEAFDALIRRLIDASIEYLCRQIEAGVEVVQIFDSWAGSLPANEFESWSVGPIRQIVAGVKARRREARIIVFQRGANNHLPRMTASLGADAYGLDTSVDAKWAAATIAPKTALQGNLDPLALVAGGLALEREVAAIMDAFRGRPHIFNLGHGIIPETPVENVERLLKLVGRGS